LVTVGWLAIVEQKANQIVGKSHSSRRCISVHLIGLANEIFFANLATFAFCWIELSPEH
jgi:hypothetical protein